MFAINRDSIEFRPRLRAGAMSQGLPSPGGFSLVELLVVIAIIAILIGIVSPLVPSLLNANRIDSDVTTLSGILEEARETATANNTYVWVAFTDAPAASPSTGLWVATIQSQDGTETGINTGSVTSPVWTVSITIPGTNLLLHSKLQNLPGVQIDATGAKVPASVLAKAPSSSPAYLQNSLQWTVTTLANTGIGSNVYFTHAIEFTPDGEAHVPTWNSNIQFGIYPAVGTKGASTNYILYNVTRLTGKAATFRM